MDSRNTLWKWTAAALLAATTGTAWAAERPEQSCDNATLQAIARQVGQQNWQVPEWDTQAPVVAAACKPWPDDPKLQVFAVAYIKPGTQQDADSRDLDLIVGQLDTASGTLRTRYEGSIGEDAMTQLDYRGLRLDTARYWLAPETRAFGVVVHSSANGPSCPDGGANDALTLYVAQGNQLRDVFTTYLNQWTTLEGTSCAGDLRLVTERSKITLEVAKQASHGFADLIATATVQREDNGDDVGAPRRVKSTLHYNGERYPFEEFSDFWQSKTTAQP